MRSFSFSRAARPSRIFAATLLWGLATAMPLQAGQYQLMAGQANAVAVAARVENGETVCNLEISVEGQAVFEREVKAPYFEARIAITPLDTESVSVTWRGKFKRVNTVVVNACPTQGQAQFTVVSNNAHLRAIWSGVLSQMPASQAECVRGVLQSEGVQYEWFDLSDKQVSPHDWRINRAVTQCEAFLLQPKAWGEKDPKGFACVLAGGLKTQCEGYYTAIVNGKSQPISKEQAIARQLYMQAWSTGVRESAAGKEARQRQVQAVQTQRANEAAAQIMAEKAAQARAAQRVKEAQEAEIRERNAKIDAELAQKIQEIRRKEQERLDKRNWLRKKLETWRDGKPPEADSEAKPEEAPVKKASEATAKEVKPPEAKPPEAKPAEAKPAQAKPPEANPAETKPAEAKPAEAKASPT